MSAIWDTNLNQYMTNFEEQYDICENMNVIIKINELESDAPDSFVCL